MSTRFAKQIIYGAFYLVVLVLVVWGGHALFFRSAPATPAAPALVAAPIQVLGAVQVFSANPGYDTFLAKIANPNGDLAAQYVPFSFVLPGASGTLQASFSGATFLYPNQVKYVALVNQAVSDGPGAMGAVGGGASGVAAIDVATGWILDIPTSTVQWIASSSFGAPPALAVQNVATTIGSSTLSGPALALATGELANNDTATFTNVFILAIFKDANGNPIGASQTEVDSIAPNTTQHFSISYPAVGGIDPTQTEVQAYAERP